MDSTVVSIWIVSSTNMNLSNIVRDYEAVILNMDTARWPLDDVLEPVIKLLST